MFGFLLLNDRKSFHSFFLDGQSFFNDLNNPHFVLEQKERVHLLGAPSWLALHVVALPLKDIDDKFVSMGAFLSGKNDGRFKSFYYSLVSNLTHDFFNSDFMISTRCQHWRVICLLGSKPIFGFVQDKECDAGADGNYVQLVSNVGYHKGQTDRVKAEEAEKVISMK